MEDKKLQDFLPEINSSYKKEFNNEKIKSKIEKEEVIECIKTVMDPEIPVNLYDLGLIYEIKINDKNDFNYKYLSNYFSALLSFDNQKNEKALEFFETSKSLKRKHDKFLKEYVYALVLDGQVKKAITQIKSSRNSFLSFLPFLPSSLSFFSPLKLRKTSSLNSLRPLIPAASTSLEASSAPN